MFGYKTFEVSTKTVCVPFRHRKVKLLVPTPFSVDMCCVYRQVSPESDRSAGDSDGVGDSDGAGDSDADYELPDDGRSDVVSHRLGRLPARPARLQGRDDGAK